MIAIRQNNRLETTSIYTNDFGGKVAADVHSFHKTIPVYQPTPLYNLKGLANKLNIDKIWLKDESHRFGLKAFKVLGTSYAVAKLLSEMLGLNKDQLSFSAFQNPAIKNRIKEFTLVTATDGNHGRGVAWTAQQFGCKCVVYMPRGTTQARLQNIQSHGADASIIDGNYDDAVLLAKTNSGKFEWILVQDSSWEGYTKIPLWIMQGYLTMMGEVKEQLEGEVPTHVFVQCGVGSLPAAILAYYVEKHKSAKPIFAVVEPGDAGCVYESFTSQKLSSLKNEMNTIMAGLACGTPSLLAWKILNDHSDYFIKCSDDITIKGMQILGQQEFGDPKIISGESGAVTTGLIYYLLSNPRFKSYADKIGLDKNSKVLLISTEGDTDPGMYNKILAQ